MKLKRIDQALKLSDGRELAFPDKGAEGQARWLADVICNKGYDVASGEHYEFNEIKDTLNRSGLAPFFETSLEYAIREPLLPLMQISNLFTPIPAKGGETRVLHGAIGDNIFAQQYAELTTLQEQSIQVGGGIQVSTIDKYGVQISYSDEVARYTNWPVVDYNLRKMRVALMKLKEEKAVSMLQLLGLPLFDNKNPATSVFGVTTGRGIDMAANGSLTVDDLFKAQVQMIEEGFIPSALVIPPQAFLLFAQDPIFRNLFLMGMGGDYFRLWSGNPGPTDPWSNGSLGKLGPSMGNQIVPQGNASGASPTGIESRAHGMTSAFPAPSPFPWSLRIIVSPFVPFDPDTGLFDIFLISEGDVGFILVDETESMVEWRDNDLEKTVIRMKERYSFAVANDGQGVGVLKNMKVARNYWDGGVHVVHDEALSAISATASVL